MDPFTRLLIVTCRVLAIPQTGVTVQSRFKEDLGADALDCLNLWMELEDEFGFTDSQDRWMSVSTLSEALVLITEMTTDGIAPVRHPKPAPSARELMAAAMAEDEETRHRQPTGVEQLRHDLELDPGAERPGKAPNAEKGT